MQSTPLNPRVERLIERWYAKAKRESDSFSKFIFLYFCFNAIITNLSDEETDRAALNWIYANENILRRVSEECLQNPGIARGIRQLQTIGSIPTYRRPTPMGPDRLEIENPASIESVLNFIYQVRCNLFHGRKAPDDYYDKRLVALSCKILQGIISGVLTRRGNGAQSLSKVHFTSDIAKGVRYLEDVHDNSNSS